MAFNVEFYRFSKKPNSTKIPADADLILSASCVLLDGNSVISPRISIRAEENVTLSNYARIAAFRRYYFVTDWTFVDGLWVASLAVDVLASYKAIIGNSEQYILRSSSNYDGSIVDSLYPTKSAPVLGWKTSEEPSPVNPFVSNFEDGIFVVGIISNTANAVGAVSYYRFSNAQFRAFCAALMGSANWVYSGIDEIGEELLKVLFNPFQYVASCVWFPLSSAFGGISVKSVDYGWWRLNCEAVLINSFTALTTNSFTLPKHPQKSRGVYMNAAPFSRYSIKWPPIGDLPLDGALTASVTDIVIQCYIDAVSGKGVYAVLDVDTNSTLYQGVALIGVPIQIAQITTDYVGGIAELGSATSSLFSGDFLGALSGINDAVRTASPKVARSGVNGCITAYRFSPSLEYEFYRVVDEDPEHRGKPLCKTVKINTLNGYILASDAHIEISGSIEEANQIINYMNGGFYYE